VTACLDATGRGCFTRTAIIDGGSSCLKTVRTFVEEAASAAGLRQDRAFDLKVAASEACANALEHGGNAGSCLQVSAAGFEDRLEFEVADGGAFRLPHAVDHMQRAHRGLGLPLMVALTDEVRISRPAEGGTRVTLIMYADRPPQAPLT